MQEKFLNVLIGTNIDRTASLVVQGSTANIAAGEVAIIDKNGTALTSGATIADTEYIQIVEGQSDTYDYVDTAGSSVTGIRKLIYSAPIYCNDIVDYYTEDYTAIAEQVSTISFGTLTPVIDEEYVIKLVYTDMQKGSAQVTKTYRFTAETTTLADLYAGLMAVINSDKNRRVDCTGGSTNLVLTGKEYDDDLTVDSLNEYKQVAFKVFLYSDNFASDASITLTTAPSKGSGDWKLVRDEEKWSQGDRGLRNRVKFPVDTLDFRTVKDGHYDGITIVSNNKWIDASSQYANTHIVTKIFIATAGTSATNQADTLVTALNTWVASGASGKTATALS